MQIGNYKVYFIDVEPLKIDSGILFGQYPYTGWSEYFKPDEKNRILLANRVLLIKSDKRIILIDTGAGDKLSDESRLFYGMVGPSDQLICALNKIGINENHITDVLLTHLHFDRCGGATRFVGKDILPVFPNAMYWIQHEQWEWANIPSPLDKSYFMKNDFYPVAQHEHLMLANEEFEMIPGVEILVMQGHTPGMQIVKIQDEENIFLYPGDLIPTSVHIEDNVIMGCDLYPLFTIEEKYNILSQAAEEDWTILFNSDPFNKAAKIKLTEDGYRVKELINDF